MNRPAILILAATLAGSAAAYAQTANPMSTEAKQAYTGIKNNLMKMAEKMPEENYAFKPTPEIRTFGQLVGHVADSQLRTCSAVKGDMKNGTAGTKTSKADLVAALKESFAECDGAYDSLTDATAADMIKTARGPRSKLGALVGNTTHSNEEYGYMSVYLRLKGVVPPSSEPKVRGNSATLEVFIFHAPEDQGVAAAVAERLEFLAGVKARVEPCESGDTVEDVWEQGLGSSAVLLLLSPSSVPAVATRDKWASLLKHRESNALPPLGLIQVAPCKCPQVLERKHFFRYADNPQRALRDLTHWISNLAVRTEPHFSPARLPWFQGRDSELDLLWELLVDEAGVAILFNPAARSGKTALAQEFVRASGSHFRDVYWVACGNRSEISIAGELATHLGVSLGNQGEDAFARIGALIQERRVLLVLDDVPDSLPIATAGGGRASVLVTTSSEEAAGLSGATVIQVEPAPLLEQDFDALTPAASRLWDAICVCRPQRFPLELAARIARLEASEVEEARNILVDQRWIDPLDLAGSQYRLGAGSPQFNEALSRSHSAALIDTFLKWGSQPGPCRTLLVEMDAGFHWALRSNWTQAAKLGHLAAGFLNREGRIAEAIYVYRQLLLVAREQNDPHEVEHCVRELSWLEDNVAPAPGTPVQAEQTAFNF